MINKKLLGVLLLLITAFLWGSSTVPQRLGSEYLGSFTFNAVRFISVGFIFLIIYIPAKKSDTHKHMGKKLFICSIIVGALQFFGSGFQQLAITYTNSTAKTAFLSSLNVVLVPVVGLFFKRKTSLMMIPIIGVAVIGSYLISVSDSMVFDISDLYILLSDISFATQIVLISIISKEINSIKLCCIQFFVGGLISLIVAFFVDIKTIVNIELAIPSMLYAVFLSAAIANLFQAIGLRYVDGTIGGLVLSFQGVFGLFASVLFFNEAFTTSKIIGCSLVFVALILSQIDWDKIFKKKLESIPETE